MNEKLVLRLSSQKNQQIPWLVWSEGTQDVIASGTLDSVEQLADIQHYAVGRKVTVLVDGADITLIKHSLPNKPNRQILQALPFMLEEELAEDIDQLHFTVADSGQDEDSKQFWIQVSVVKKALLSFWLEKLAENNISAACFLPETLCLPKTESELSVMEFNQGWLYRVGDWQGSFVTQTWLSLIFKPAEQQLNTVTAYSMLPDAFLVDDMEVDNQLSDMPLLLLAQQAARMKFNLLHGEFQPKKPVSKNWLIWRPAVFMTLIVAVLSLVESFIVIEKAEQQTKHLSQQLIAEYKAVFPKETPRVNIIRRQLERKLADAQGGSVASDGFLQVFTDLAPALQDVKTVKLESVKYETKRNELRLSARTDGFQSFEQFKTAIEKLGFEAKQGTLNNDEGDVVGVLVIKRNAS